MKFSIIGTGGVGGYFGGLLARAGEDVTFVARGEHFAALTKNGLTLRTVEESFENLPVKVVDSVDKLPAPDVVLVCTKTYDRDEVACRLAQVVEPSTVVIPLQNGIDNDVRLKALLPNARVYAGLCYIISARTAPGVVEQTAGPRTIIFGERGVAENSTLKELEGVMRRASILATASKDIERDLWIKFLWLTTFAGMTAVCRTPIGPIVSDEAAFALFVRCLDEGIAVARKAGADVSEDDRAQMIHKSAQYQAAGGHAKSSLLVDIENNRRTEIESLSGTIVRLAEQYGIPVPIHETIYRAVKLASEHYLAR